MLMMIHSVVQQMIQNRFTYIFLQQAIQSTNVFINHILVYFRILRNYF